MPFEIDLLSFFAIVSPPTIIQIAIVVGVYKIWTTLDDLKRNYKVLNHNSTKIVKALLKAGLLSPDDIKDVEV